MGSLTGRKKLLKPREGKIQGSYKKIAVNEPDPRVCTVFYIIEYTEEVVSLENDERVKVTMQYIIKNKENCESIFVEMSPESCVNR
mmetsp:Transcript_41803/g.43810  ORF Transcript_41803/g.43810 Transcript_41803/m.43810 type:complete len:86 (-) Transcript_41803:38-295(-)